MGWRDGREGTQSLLFNELHPTLKNSHVTLSLVLIFPCKNIVML
jgi:hypothetical protein